MNVLDSFREATASLYQGSLGVQLKTDGFSESDVPQWFTVSRNNYQILGNDIGVLLDPMVGLTIFVIKYQQGEDLNAEIRQALQFSDKLQPTYQSDIIDGSFGTWQVGLLWLVEGDDLEKEWKNHIAERRKQSGFSEELMLDVVFYDELDGLKSTVEDRGLPSLLLQARKLFSMDRDSMSSWHSANEEVAAMLKTFPLRFKDSKESEVASHLVKQALEEFDSSDTHNFPDLPETISDIEVKNFRNIDNCELKFQADKVEPKVVFGPNGTGKTAIFEALSLALCGSSRRFRDYLNDTDARPLKPYEELVLSPLRNGADRPEVRLNGDSWSNLDNDKEKAVSQLLGMEGTLLEQEESQQFSREKKGELAARVLRGYSTLADLIQQKAEEGFEGKSKLRKELLSKYGLNSGITKIETLREKVLNKILDSEMPDPPLSLTSWLASMSGLMRQDPDWKNLSARWVFLSDKTMLKQFFSEFIKLGSGEVLNSLILSRLTLRRQLIDDTSQALANLRRGVGSLQENIDQVINDLNLWAIWIDQQSAIVPSEDVGPQILELQAALEVQQKARDKLAVEGKSLRGRQEHFQQTKLFIETWASAHPEECPTCSADHTDSGGILTVTERLSNANNEALEQTRIQYGLISNEIKKIETSMATLGQSICPLSVERRDEITLIINDIETDSIEVWLKNPEERKRVVSVLRSLKVLPVLPTLSEDDDAEAERVAEEVTKSLTEANRVWDEPALWSEVKKKLSKACMEIVETHMPRTLQAVWGELVFALTPARWNLPAEPSFKFGTLRNNSEMRVVTNKCGREILARYLFNQAEIHLLGLAWFFMRYLSYGRFRYTLIALDDPAQEMDQTTYRTFIRFLQKLTRLHKKQDRPLSMLIFLHQEDRALDASRALDAEMNVLGWEREQSNDGRKNHSMTEVKLLSEQFRPTSAIKLFKNSEAQLAE